MKCRMVFDQDGFYQIPGSGTEENWDEVKDNATEIRHIYPLTGWGEYTDVWKVEVDNGVWLTYFVDEDS